MGTPTTKPMVSRSLSSWRTSFRAIEAIRLKATRLAVIRRGKVIAETPPRVAALDLPGRPATVDPATYAPRDASWSD